MKLTEDHRTKMRELRASGLTYLGIASQIGCSKETVRRELNPEVKERNLLLGREWYGSNREHKLEVCRVWSHNNPLKRLVSDAHQRANEYGVDFDSAIEYELVAIPSYCPLCREAMARNVGEKGPSTHSPSIDRINPALGYIPGNVQWLCLGCNAAKGSRILKVG